MNISFALMSGGQGKRFGSDKTKVALNGKPLFSYGLELGLSVSEDVMHVSRNIYKYEPFMEGVKYLSDEYSSMCPMAGMLTAATHALHDYIFILSADTPLFDKSFIEYFKSVISGRDAVIPSIKGKFHTLASLYSKRMLLGFKPFYEKGEYKIASCLKHFDVFYPTEAELLPKGLQERSFLNINTPQDLEKAVKLLS